MEQIIGRGFKTSEAQITAGVIALTAIVVQGDYPPELKSQVVEVVKWVTITFIGSRSLTKAIHAYGHHQGDEEEYESEGP
ncbi:MAG: hypothetical protein AAFQ53_07490 [Bacteroidota bacterium]